MQGSKKDRLDCKRTIREIIPFILGALFFTSCSLMDRRDFEDIMEEDQFESSWMPGVDFDVVKGDTSSSYTSEREIIRRTPSGYAQSNIDKSYLNSMESELDNLESKLTKSEFEHYESLKSSLGHISERIYYLTLDPRDRESYLVAKGIDQLRIRDEKFSLKESNTGSYWDSTPPISVGMSKVEVVKRWGGPLERVFLQSDQEFPFDNSQVERWSYQIAGRLKFVFFREELVDGWITP